MSSVICPVSCLLFYVPFEAMKMRFQTGKYLLGKCNFLLYPSYCMLILDALYDFFLLFYWFISAFRELFLDIMLSTCNVLTDTLLVTLPNC